MQDPPSPAALFACFFRIGMLSFGGALTAWMYRDVVQRRGWLDDRQFLSGQALGQLAPGPGAVNLSVYIGARLQGARGACAALLGLLLGPVLLILGLGALYLSHRTLPGVEAAMAGLGAAAVGLNLAAGLRMARRNLRGLPQTAVMVATALSVGLLGWGLLPALAVMLPVSWLATRTRRA